MPFPRKHLTLRKKSQLLAAFLSLSSVTTITNAETWTETFDDLSGWHAGSHELNNGILTAISNDGDSIYTTDAPLSTRPISLKFKAKPAAGTPGYAALAVHVFTSETGSINQESYAINLSGSQLGGYKIERAGYDTVFYSGQGGGLFTSDSEWHEIELKITNTDISVFNDGNFVNTIAINTLPDTPKGSNITIKAESGQWDFDWIQVHTDDENPESPTDTPDVNPDTEATENSTLDLSLMDWVEPFNHLDNWQGGNHPIAGGVLTLSQENGDSLTTKLPVYDALSASTEKPARLHLRLKPSVGTPNYATLGVKMFTNAEGNDTAHSYELIIKGNESAGYKIVRAGYDTQYWSGQENGLLTNDQTWHDIEVAVANGTLNLWRDQELVNELQLPNFPSEPSGQYLTLTAESGNWDFDTIATAGSHHREEFDDLSRWTNAENHQLQDSVLTLTSSDGDSLTSKQTLVPDFDSTVRFSAKPSAGTPNYATLQFHLFTGPNGELNNHTYSLIMKGSSSDNFKIVRAGYDTQYYSGNGFGLLTDQDTWQTVTIEIKNDHLLVYRGDELMVDHLLQNLPQSPTASHITLEAESGNWDFDWLSSNSQPQDVLPSPLLSPLNLTALNTTFSSTQLQWQAPPQSDAITGYVIYRDGTEIARTSSLNYTDQGLTADQSYQYQVASYNSQELSGQIPTIVITTLATPIDPPATPTALDVNSVSISAIELTWIAPANTENLLGYIIFRDGIEIARTSSTSYEDVNLEPDHSYQYQVATYDDSQQVSALSPSNTVSTAPEVSAAVRIQHINDQTAAISSVYQYQPTQLSALEVNWSKEYGPDDATVDPVTGMLQWTIPADMASESIHLGVKAMASDGSSSIETWILTIGDVPQIIYVGKDEVYKTVADGLDALVSGGTLIIRDGVYRGDESDFINNFAGGSLPPSGNADNFTTIIAENPGKVILDGEGKSGSVIRISGNWINPDWPEQNVGSGPLEYISFRGIHVDNSLNSGIFVSNVQYMKLIDMGVSDSGRKAQCSFTGGSSCGATNIYVRRSNQVLLEDVYTWGHARYQIGFRKSMNSVVRRAVSRIDGYIGREPVGSMMTYCSKNIDWQNSVVVDSNSEKFWARHTYMSNSFGYAASDCKGYPENSTYHSGIALNNSLPFTGMNDDHVDAKFNYVKNSIGWGDTVARDNHGHSGPLNYINMTGPLETDQLTLGQFDTKTKGYFFHDYHPLRISNSIIYRSGWDGEKTNPRGLMGISPSELTFNYVNFFDNGMTDWSIANGNYAGNVYFPNRIEIDPRQNGLTYLPKIDEGSVLATAGEGGKRLGAHIINRLGRSGKFYGQQGWDELTEQPLWPYPHQDLIKQKFADYSYTGPTRTDQVDQVGPDDTLKGARGFAAPGNGLYGGPITLTSYIWEQLGSPCPEGICPAVSPSIEVQSTSTHQVDLDWSTTDDTLTIVGYKVFRDGIEIAIATDPAYIDNSLQPNTSYRYSIQGFDAEGNLSSKIHSVTVTTLALPDTSAPTTPTGLQAQATSSTQVNLEWSDSTDDTAVTGYKVFRDGTELATPHASHYNDAGLTPDTVYSYTVVAFDAAGNQSSQTAIVSATTSTQADVTPPTAPSGLQSQSVSITTATLSWDAANDDNEVAGYKIYRDDVAIATTVELTFSETNLTPNTTYTYAVSALDTASNESLISTALSIVTLSGDHPTSDPITLDPITISQGSDDGYSWGKYSDSWSTHNVDLDNIRFGGAGNEDREYVSSFMFRGVNVPAGQNILSAKLIFSAQAYQNDGGTINLSINGLDPVSQDTFADGNMGQDRTTVDTAIAWVQSASTIESPNIASIIQDIVNDQDWVAGQAMGFVVRNQSGATGDVRHNIFSYDAGEASKSPKLVITYGEDLVPPVISGGSPSGLLSFTTTQVDLTVTTNEPSTCKFSSLSGVDYSAMELTLATEKGKKHTANLSGLQNDSRYEYFVRCADSKGNSTQIDYVVSFDIVSINDPILTLTIEEPAGINQSNAPVRTGVPFPRGLLQADDTITLSQGQSNLPVQTKPLSLWDDGSVRWLLLDSQVSLDANQAQEISVKFSNGSNSVSNPIEVTETDDLIAVNTGPLQFSVPKTNGGIIHSATVDDVVVIAPPTSASADRGPWVSVGGSSYFGGLLKHDSVRLASDPIALYENYINNDWGVPFNLHKLWDLSVTVEEQGDLHTVIRISGTHLNSSGLGYSSFVTRVHAYRGQSQLKIDHTLIFTGTGNDQITDYGFRLPYTGATTIIEGIATNTGSVTHLEYDYYNTRETDTDTETITSGQAKGYVARTNGSSSVTIALRDMAENFPKGLAATDSGIEVQLYPESATALDLKRYSTTVDTDNGEAGDHKNRAAQGLSKTDSFVVNFATGAFNQAEIENKAIVLDAGPLMALADPDWYSDTRVMGIGDFTFETELSVSEHHYRIDRKLDIIQDFMRFNQREQYDWYGMLNYGDIRGWFHGGCAPGHSADCSWHKLGRYGWSGNSGEPSNQLWIQFMRKPSRDTLADAVALAKHTQDIQMVHYGDATGHADDSIQGGRNREFAVGSLHRHGRQAWSGYAQTPEYSHIAGVETYYYLTGDGRAKEALFEAASFITRYSENTPAHTALVNGIDTLTRAAAVFYDDPEHATRFGHRLEVLINHLDQTDGVNKELAGKSLGQTFDYFIRGAGGLLYHHERSGDARVAELIFDAADYTTSGGNGDIWGVGANGSAGGVWYYMNSLTYAASIGEDYNRSVTPYYDLVSKVMANNDHAVEQSSSHAISLESLNAVPEDWKNWSWIWDENSLSPDNPALLHIARQMTFRNDFMQDYHSYRAFIHLSTGAALTSP